MAENLSNPKIQNLPGQETQAVADIIAAVGKKILDKEDAIKTVVAALLAGGHVLVEDLPGLGKTTL